MFKREKISIDAIIGKGVECNGDFTAQGSARVDGTVSGKVVVEGRLIIGEKGFVKSGVKAKSAIIAGEVHGDVYAPERLELTPAAKIYGDITTAVLVVDEGAVIRGKIDMSTEILKEETKAEEAAPAVEQPKAEEQPKVEEQPKAEEQPKVEEQPKAEEQPKSEEAATAEEQPKKDMPKKRSAKIAFFKALKEMEESKREENSEGQSE